MQFLNRNKPLSILTATVVLPFLPPMPLASAFTTIPKAPSPNSLPKVSLDEGKRVHHKLCIMLKDLDK